MAITHGEHDTALDAYGLSGPQLRFKLAVIDAAHAAHEQAPRAGRS